MNIVQWDHIVFGIRVEALPSATSEMERLSFDFAMWKSPSGICLAFSDHKDVINGHVTPCILEAEQGRWMCLDCLLVASNA